MSNKLIVGISGTSGVILGIRLLEELKKLKIETHLVMTETAEKIIEYETKYKIDQVKKLANFFYDNKNFFAKIASGSFRTLGMVVIPCSMKTISGIANGYADNLLLRSADVCLKERRKLILVVRETPLSLIHIKNMEKITLAGGIIMPANLIFYSKPKIIDDMIDHIIGKVLDLFEIKNDIYKRWEG